MLVLTMNEENTIELRDRASGELIGTLLLMNVQGGFRGRQSRARVAFDFPMKVGITRGTVDDRLKAFAGSEARMDKNSGSKHP